MICAKTLRVLIAPAALVLGCAASALAQTPAPRAPVEAYAPPPSSDYYSTQLGIRYQLVPYGSAYGARLTAYPSLGSPAAQIQLEPGDMIIALDGLAIRGPNDVENHYARTTVTFINIRTNRPQTNVVHIPNLPGGGSFPPAPPIPPTPPPPPGNAYVLGVAAQPVLLGRQTVLQITQITPGSAAAAAGLQIGDQLISANGQRLVDQATLSRAINTSGGFLKLEVRRASGYVQTLTANLTPSGPIYFGSPAP